MHRQRVARNGKTATTNKVQTASGAYVKFASPKKNADAHPRITDKLRAGVGVPVHTEAAQAPLKERGNTGVRNAAETFSSYVLQFRRFRFGFICLFHSNGQMEAESLPAVDKTEKCWRKNRLISRFSFSISA